MVIATKKSFSNSELNRYKRYQARQAEIKFGKDYKPAIAVGEVRGAIGGSGELYAARLGRWVHAHSWPEKVAAALALYSGVFELQEQQIYYPQPIGHPLSKHPSYSSFPWPYSDGTFLLAQELGLLKWHPKVWDAEKDSWHIGCWIADFVLYQLNAEFQPYMLIWEVKDKKERHGQPGGSMPSYSERRMERVKARNAICSAYAEQLGSRIVEVSTDEMSYQLKNNLVSLCRNHSTDIDLAPTLIAELLQAYQEAIGLDVTPLDIAKDLIRHPEQMATAKALLDVAVWQRKVRVDLYQPILWNRPLLPEKTDVLIDYAKYFQHSS